MFKNAASFLYTLIPVVAVVAPLRAQARVELGPLVGLYAPTASFQPAPYYSTALPNSPGDLTAAAWGGQARLWFGPRAGIQLQVASAASSVGGGNTPGGPMPPTPARVLTASAQFLWSFASSHQNLRGWLSGGLGVIRHGGSAYERYGSPIQLGTAVGVGAAWPVGHRLIASVGMTTLLYNIDVSDSTGTSLEHGFQVDPLIHAGISVQLH